MKSIRLPQSMLDELKAKHLNISALIRDLLAQYLKAQEGDVIQVIQERGDTLNSISSSSLILKEGESEREIEFNEFWAAYPRKVGKQDAKRAWAKAKKIRPALETILASIEAAKQSDQWTRDNGQYIPNPSTWINQGRWDDVLAPRPLTTFERFLARGDDDEQS